MFCKLTGTPLPKDAAFDGEELTAAFFGKSVVRGHALFWEYGRNASFGYPRIPRDRRPETWRWREGKMENCSPTPTAPAWNSTTSTPTATRPRNIAEANPDVAKRMSEAALGVAENRCLKLRYFFPPTAATKFLHQHGSFILPPRDADGKRRRPRAFSGRTFKTRPGEAIEHLRHQRHAPGLPPPTR